MYLAIIAWIIAASALSPLAVWFVSKYCEVELDRTKKVLLYSVLCGAGSAAGALCFITQGVSVAGAMASLTIYAAIIASAVDFICREIPPLMNIIILICSVVICAFDYKNIATHLLGAAVVGGTVLLMYLLSRGKAMGGGDAKLMLSSCLGLGLANSLFAVIVAFPLAAIVQGVRIAAFKKSREFAFGPFLACGIATAYIVGNQAVSWYLSLIGLGG